MGRVHDGVALVGPVGGEVGGEGQELDTQFVAPYEPHALIQAAANPCSVSNP